ncbi:MAG: hypothetical protein ACI4M6_04445 [Christensenellaceae bacterium]
MKLIYITSFIDGLMVFSGCFVLFNCIFKSMGLFNKLSGVFALLLAVIFFILFLRLNLSSSQKKQFKTTLSKKKKQFVDSLISMSDSEIVGLLNEYVFDKSQPISRLNGNYTYNGYTLIFLFLPEKVSANLVAYVLKNVNPKEKTAVFCTIFDKDALSYCKSNKVLTFSVNEIYDAIEKTDYLQDMKTTATKRFDLGNLKFRSNYKRALFFGISLAVLGNFSFFPIYYQISGSLFIIYGIVIAFLGKISPKTESSLKAFASKQQNSP